MKDYQRVADWPDMHWKIARGTCVGIVLLGLLLVWLQALSAVAATVATLAAIGYVLGLTRHYARKPPR
ncbi:MAG: hypothetical protein V4633_05155 [Pseudomonadota bacterium]